MCIAGPSEISFMFPLLPFLNGCREKGQGKGGQKTSTKTAFVSAFQQRNECQYPEDRMRDEVLAPSINPRTGPRGES